MDQNPPGTSELPQPQVQVKVAPDLVVHITRQFWDDYFKLEFTIDGRPVSEELLPDETRQWFKDHMARPISRELGLARDEALNRQLDEAWNFNETYVRIPGDVYREPIKPFPAFQPQV